MKLGGYAGTGKTVLVKYLMKFFPSYAAVAYTGKAASVVRKNGIHATTIHSRIYRPYFDNGVTYFELNPFLGHDGFLVDESSMVPRDIYSDLKSFGLPVVFVGDHGQLEPVDSDFNLMADPDFVLEEIHRNAGDIAKFAEHLRNGFGARSFLCDDGSVEFVSDAGPEVLSGVEQVICAYNKSRVEVNKTIREHKGYDDVLHVGERVMCLRNSRQAGLFNGMQGTVVGLSDGRYGRKYMDFQFDASDRPIEGVLYDPACFGKENYKFKTGKDSPHPFEYAYCITCHKAQGDQFDSVLVLEQRCKKWSHKRWAYTAASRAKKKLLWKHGF